MQKTLPTRFRMLVAAALLTGLGLLFTPPMAHAHDVLVESDPEIGSTVDTAPTEVRLRFSGTPLSGEGLTNLIRVTDAQDNQWQDGEVSIDGYELSVPLCDSLPQGEYTVAYRVIYSDGHTGEERFNFTNADPNAPEDGTPENCGEVSEQAPAETPEASDTNETQDTSDANEPADENSSPSLPGWIWVAGGAGVVVIAGIVFLLLRGSRTEEQPDDTSDD